MRAGLRTSFGWYVFLLGAVAGCGSSEVVVMAGIIWRWMFAGNVGVTRAGAGGTTTGTAVA